MVLNGDHSGICKLENNSYNEKLEVGALPPWTFALIGGLTLGLMILIFWIMKIKRNKVNDEVSIDINPDYGYDYGEAEIRDTNDYYFAEDYDHVDEKRDFDQNFSETKQL